MRDFTALATNIVSEIADIQGIVVFDGPSGAGKTSLTLCIQKLLNQQGISNLLFHLDDYLTWNNPVDWTEKLLQEVINPYFNRKNIIFTKNIWNKNNEIISQEKRELTWAPLLIVEGFAAAAKNIIPEIELAYFVSPSTLELAYERALQRDGVNSQEHHQNWYQYTRAWFAVDGTASRCKLVTVP